MATTSFNMLLRLIEKFDSQCYQGVALTWDRLGKRRLGRISSPQLQRCQTYCLRQIATFGGGGEEFEMKKIPFFGQRDSSSNPQGKKTQEIFLRKRMAFNVRQQWIRSGEQSGWRRGGFGFRGGCLRIVSHGMADEIGDFFKFFAADFAA